MINESSLSTVEIGLDFDFKAFYIREEKRREQKEEEEGEKRERKRAQMGEMDVVDTQTVERERMTLFTCLDLCEGKKKKKKKKGLLFVFLDKLVLLL
jgi:hypothetical protein